jgi:phosphoribosyl-AMP cyclohydrolase
LAPVAAIQSTASAQLRFFLNSVEVRVPPHGQPTAEAPLPNFAKGNGLLPAVAQDAATGEVLMVAYMNAESFAETVATGRAVYFSRSKGRLWRKGEESGHVQQVVQILVDCDADTILLKVNQQGPACHEGYRSCFFRELSGDSVKIVRERLVDPATVYGPQ